jgi:hypothetical protein
LARPFDVFRHNSLRDYVIFERSRRVWFWNPAKHPKKIIAKISFGLQPDATGASAWYEGLDLNMDETRASKVAAQDIGVRGIAESDDSGVTATAQFPCDEKLARISSRAFVAAEPNNRRKIFRF